MFFFSLFFSSVLYFEIWTKWCKTFTLNRKKNCTKILANEERKNGMKEGIKINKQSEQTAKQQYKDFEYIKFIDLLAPLFTISIIHFNIQINKCVFPTVKSSQLECKTVSVRHEQQRNSVDNTNQAQQNTQWNNNEKKTAREKKAHTKQIYENWRKRRTYTRVIAYSALSMHVDINFIWIHKQHQQQNTYK